MADLAVDEHLSGRISLYDIDFDAARNSEIIFAHKLPDDIQSLVMRHVLNQETILHAALNRDKEMAFRAFFNDPLVTIDIVSARQLFDEMLENTRNTYLTGIFNSSLGYISTRIL